MGLDGMRTQPEPSPISQTAQTAASTTPTPKTLPKAVDARVGEAAKAPLKDLESAHTDPSESLLSHTVTPQPPGYGARITAFFKGLFSGIAQAFSDLAAKVRSLKTSSTPKQAEVLKATEKTPLKSSAKAAKEPFDAEALKDIAIADPEEFARRMDALTEDQLATVLGLINKFVEENPHPTEEDFVMRRLSDGVFPDQVSKLESAVVMNLAKNPEQFGAHMDRLNDAQLLAVAQKMNKFNINAFTDKDCEKLYKGLSPEQALRLTKALAEDSISSTTDSGTIFRNTSTATRFIAILQRDSMPELFAQRWLPKEDIPQEAFPVEYVNQKRVLTVSSENKKLELMKQVIGKAAADSERVPPKVREFNRFVQSRIDANPRLGKIPFQHQSFFLRFLSPSLAQPRPDQTPGQTQNLIHIGSAVQKLANSPTSPEFQDAELQRNFQRIRDNMT